MATNKNNSAEWSLMALSVRRFQENDAWKINEIFDTKYFNLQQQLLSLD